jgi:hypothetical protein
MNPVQKIVSQPIKLNIAYNKFLILVLAFCSSLSMQVLAQQELNTISSVYFNSPSSFVIETANLVNLKPESVDKKSSDSFILNFSDVQLSKNLASKISTPDFQLELKALKSAQAGVFKKYDRLQILVKTSIPNKTLSYNSRVLLSGFASQYKLSAEDFIAVDTARVAKPSEPLAPLASLPKPAIPEERSSSQLQISFNQDDLKASQEFLERINQPELLNDDKFISEILTKLDIVALEQIAQILNSQAQKSSAELAYRKILSLDPNNHKALIQLAELTADPDEKTKNYLQALDQRALESLANSWTREKKPDSPAKALLLRQISILKDPQNPILRLECAQLYESMGFSYYTLSAKRYLESAVLAKNQYLSGNLQAETILRTATESLIRVLSHQGDELMAIKYCQSYLDLGFRRFTDGKPIVAVIKELQAHQNPFRT